MLSVSVSSLVLLTPALLCGNMTKSSSLQMKPSYIAFTDTECLIGDAAKKQVAMNPINIVFDPKHLIGS